MHLRQHIVTKQIQTLRQYLHPKLIQTLKIFHHSYNDLAEKIKEEAHDNVFLEITQSDAMYTASKSSQPATKDVGDYLHDVSTTGSLIDFVKQQLTLEHLTDEELAITEDLADHLDEKGFLLDYDTIKPTLLKKHHINDYKLNKCLTILQSMEPEGVGARSLKECLVIQLEAHEFENESLVKIIKTIITNHLEDLAKGNYKKIATALSLPSEGVEAAHEFIKQNLNPNPGIGFTTSTLNHHITPSFDIKYVDNELKITNLEETQGIQLQLSKNYQHLLDDPNTPEETKQYLLDKSKKAEELIQNIQKRRNALNSIITFITTRQESFFRNGSNHIVPLLQKDVAEALDLNRPTVSRIVSEKFIQTPHGLIPMKQLCPRNHFGKTATQLKHIIHTLITENPTASDQDIMKKLHKMSLPLARRTVTKYRLLQGIESSYKRPNSRLEDK